MGKRLTLTLLLRVCLCFVGFDRSCYANAQPLSIGGHVFDKSGKPIAAATLHVYNILDTEVASSTTNTVGAFQVQIPSGQSLGYSCTLEAAGYGISGGTVHANDDNIFNLYAPLTLIGQVVDGSGKPYSGALVRLVSVRIPYGARFDLPQGSEIAGRYTATTDAQGNYTITGAPRDSDCRVELADPRFVDWTGQALGGDFKVPLLETHDCAVIDGRVLHADGTPAGGVKVSASWETLAYSRSWYASAKTAGDGTYSIYGLPAGKYMLLVQQDFDDASSEWLPSSDWNNVSKRVTVTTSDGKDNNSPDLMLLRGGLITGMVIDRVTRAPVPGVVVMTMTGKSWIDPGAGISTVTDTHGRYSMYVWPGHDYIAPLEPKGYQPFNLSMQTGVPVFVAAGSSVALRPFGLTRSISTHIIGSVVDESGKPIQGIVVQPVHRDGHDNVWDNSSAPTDAGGNFTLELASQTDYWFGCGSQWIILSPSLFRVGGDQHVKIVLRSRAVTSVTGKVVDKSGDPISNVEVVVTANTDNFMPDDLKDHYRALSDRDGVYTITGIPLADQQGHDKLSIECSMYRSGYKHVKGGEIKREGSVYEISTAVLAAEKIVDPNVLPDFNDPDHIDL